MKKLICLSIFFILVSTVFAATVGRDIPSRVNPNEKITVKLNINNIQVSDAVKTFAIEESTPSGFSITDWSISGIKETKEQVKTQFAGNNYKWEFTPTGSSATITYTTTAPSLGSYTFKATWFDLSGMSGATDGMTTVTVREITCGDGVCEGGENTDNCETDCPKPKPKEEVTPAEEVKKGIPTIVIVLAVIVVIVVIILLTKKKKPAENL